MIKTIYWLVDSGISYFINKQWIYSLLIPESYCDNTLTTPPHDTVKIIVNMYDKTIVIYMSKYNTWKDLINKLEETHNIILNTNNEDMDKQLSTYAKSIIPAEPSAHWYITVTLKAVITAEIDK